MSQYTRLPAGAALTIAASGAPGAAAPAQALQVGGTDGVNLRALSVSSAGVLDVAVASLPLPSGAATAALQTAGNASLSSIDTKLTSPLTVTGPLTDTQLRAAAVPVSAASLPLPTGAATSANQATANASLSSIDTKLTAPLSVTGPLTDTQLRAAAVPVSAAALPLPSGAATSANQATANASLSSIDTKLTAPLSVTGPLTDTQLRAAAVPVSATALPLPSGASTAANQATEIASLASIDTKTPALGQALAAASVPVVLTAAQLTTLTPLSTVAATQSGTWTVQPGNTANTTAWLVNQSGQSAVQFVRNDYTSTNVTTGAYVQLIASTSSAAKVMEIFDSSGQTLKIAFGAAASEVDQFIVFPGGNGRVNINVPASTRVSIKALSATANAGEIDINLYS